MAAKSVLSSVVNKGEDEKVGMCKGVLGGEKATNEHYTLKACMLLYITAPVASLPLPYRQFKLIDFRIYYHCISVHQL